MSWAALLLRPQLWFILWCLLAATTTVLYLMPNAGPPGQYELDKVAHIIAFGSIGFSSFLSSSRSRLSAPLLAGFVLAMALEWLQSYVPGREYSTLDWGANFVGLILGGGAAFGFQAIFRRYFDHAV
jgi:VanZ family protein